MESMWRITPAYCPMVDDLPHTQVLSMSKAQVTTYMHELVDKVRKWAILYS